jgi:hypothetical protein
MVLTLSGERARAVGRGRAITFEVAALEGESRALSVEGATFAVEVGRSVARE